jgi:hypothetical protein
VFRDAATLMAGAMICADAAKLLLFMRCLKEEVAPSASLVILQ